MNSCFFCNKFLISFQLNKLSGMTPLILAAGAASDEMVAFLLSKGASPDILDAHERTALLHAIYTRSSSTPGP